jgi:hypothetical protein
MVAVSRINPVQPQREAVSQERKKDPFDLLFQGLQIANLAYGLKVDYDKSRAYEAQRAREEATLAGQERAMRGEFTEAEVRGAGFAPLTPEFAGDVPGQEFQIATRDERGVETVRPQMFARQADISKFQQDQDALMRNLELSKTPLGKAKVRKEQAALAKLEAETRKIEATTPTPKDLQQAFTKKNLENQLTRAQIEEVQNKPAVARAKSADDLRNEWSKDPITKATKVGKVAIDKIVSAEQAKPSPAGDHSLIFNYMKTVDPGSTVREGEFAAVEQAGGLIDRATVQLFNKTLEGTLLTPKQRADFINRSKLLWQQQVQNQQLLNNEYIRIGNTRGIPPEMIVLDLGLGISPTGQQQQQQPAPVQQQGGAPQQPGFQDTDVGEIQRILNQRLGGQ